MQNLWWLKCSAKMYKTKINPLLNPHCSFKYKGWNWPTGLENIFPPELLQSYSLFKLLLKLGEKKKPQHQSSVTCSLTGLTFTPRNDECAVFDTVRLFSHPSAKDGTFRDVQIWGIATSLNLEKQPFVIHDAFVRMCLFNNLHRRLSSKRSEETEHLYSCLWWHFASNLILRPIKYLSALKEPEAAAEL